MIGFTGPRDLGDERSFSLVGEVIDSVKHLGIAVGCASGLDKMVIDKYRGDFPLEVFAAFGPSGEKPVASSNVAGVQTAEGLGAIVHYWAGGKKENSAARLSGRSVRMITAVANTLRKGIVGFPDKPTGKEFTQRGRWYSSGSGTWGTIATAVMLSIPVYVFPCGDFEMPAMPVAGKWVQCDKGGVWVDSVTFRRD